MEIGDGKIDDEDDKHDSLEQSEEGIRKFDDGVLGVLSWNGDTIGPHGVLDAAFGTFR